MPTSLRHERNRWPDAYNEHCQWRHVANITQDGPVFLPLRLSFTRRGYDVTLTFGNTPTTDLLACAPNGLAFRVQVKSARSPNFVPIQKATLEGPSLTGLVFVIVIVPIEESSGFRFFIMTHREIQAAYKNLPKVTRSGQPYKPGWEGIRWSDITVHEKAWWKLPGSPRPTRGHTG
jgi:hypothetical protein